jgi:hypothetical protein
MTLNEFTTPLKLIFNPKINVSHRHKVYNGLAQLSSADLSKRWALCRAENVIKSHDNQVSKVGVRFKGKLGFVCYVSEFIVIGHCDIQKLNVVNKVIIYNV